MSKVIEKNTYKPYPSYETTQVPWLKEMPQHWNVIRTKYRFIGVKRIVGDEHKNYERLALTMRGVIKRSKESNDGLQPLNFSTYQILDRDELVFKLIDLENINTSRVGYSSELRGIVSPAYIVLKALPKQENRFFYYYFLSLYFRNVFNGLGNGVRSSLTVADLLNMPIIVPTAGEQSAIANFLERKLEQIDGIIVDKQRLIALLKEQQKAIINETVTKGMNPNVRVKESHIRWVGDIPEHWNVISLKRLTKILRGQFSHRPRNDPRFYGGKYPFLQTGDVSGVGKYIVDYKQTLNEEGLKISKEFPKGTLVMTITGAKIGEVALLTFKACFPDSIVGFVPDYRTSSEYLFYVFYAMQLAFREIATQNTQENLNVERLGELCIALPPIEEQKKIISYLEQKTEQIESLIEDLRSEIEFLNEYRQSLINEAVAGKIDVREVKLD